MADYGLEVWDKNGNQVFSKEEFGLKLLDSFVITSTSGSRSVSGLNSSCMLQVAYTGGIAVIENLYIDGSRVRWTGSRFGNNDKYRNSVTIYVNVFKRQE